jgi:hypothetical protein
MRWATSLGMTVFAGIATTEEKTRSLRGECEDCGTRVDALQMGMA